MDVLGKVAEWNEVRGFGFIQPLDAQLPRLFFHIREYRQEGRRPEPGELVRFQRVQQADGRWQATEVKRTNAPRRTPLSAGRVHTRIDAGIASGSWWPGTLLSCAYAAILAWGLHAKRVPELAVFALIGLGVATFIAYALDKRAAQHSQWRTPESTLHLMALLGGWPGAWLAQRLLRHKNRKASFQNLFWVCALANAVLTTLLVLRHP